MSTYLLVNIIIILFPALFSFEKRISFYKKFPAVMAAILIPGSFYVGWDIFAVHNHHWGFNPDHLVGIYLIGLPLEEILFFITVPYAMIFLYEVLKYYISDKINAKVNSAVLTGFLAAAMIIGSIFYMGQVYTFLALFSCGIYFLSAFLYYRDDVNTTFYWVFVLCSYVPFFIVNYILTSLPIVEYNLAAVWGIRFTTIPLEDFFYSFSMISFYIMTYRIVLSRKANILILNTAERAYDKTSKQ